MRCQLSTVPFENLDVQAGRVVSLIPEDICSKIVERGRGGYCYEVNGIFAMALAEIGIPCHFVAARPMTYPVRRPRTHMAIVATVGGESWLCDLGFGSYSIREPLSFSLLGHDVRQDGDTFRLEQTASGEFLLRTMSEEGQWKNLYEFNLHPQEWVDFEPANFLNSRHPDSIFVKGLLVVLQHATGRKILTGSYYREISSAGSTRREVSPGELPLLLREQFGLTASWPEGGSGDGDEACKACD